LLTFFYRQMPEIIEGGYLYIAQPPLYKVARGRSEIYLKDNDALDNYLIEAGIAGSVMETAGGARAGNDLKLLVDHARRMRSLMRYVPRRYDPAIIEGLAIAGALNEAVGRVATWLNLVDPQGRWSAAVGAEEGYHLQRLWRGVTDHHVIDQSFLVSQEARRLHTLVAEQAEHYATPARLIAQTKASAAAAEAAAADDDDAVIDTTPAKGVVITRPSELLDAILKTGSKGISTQRYKGLGEMNAEQLWETTLDPNARSLLRVEIAHADLADEIFTQLMGEVVEPRRDFIQENALNVANLDV